MKFSFYIFLISNRFEVSHQKKKKEEEEEEKRKKRALVQKKNQSNQQVVDQNFHRDRSLVFKNTSRLRATSLMLHAEELSTREEDFVPKSTKLREASIR